MTDDRCPTTNEKDDGYDTGNLVDGMNQEVEPVTREHPLANMPAKEVC